MAERTSRQEGGLGFLDSLERLLRRRTPEPAPAQPAEALTKIEEDFAAALRSLNEKAESFRQVAADAGEAWTSHRQTAEEREAERERRMQTAHQQMRHDIEAMHSRLGSGLAGPDLDAIRRVLSELAAIEAAGQGSHALLPRARWAIGEKLRAESGERALARTASLLRKQEMGWPDPIRHAPSATPEEVERAQRRRLADLRRQFLADGFERIGEIMLGIVRGWGSDYPDRGSPLWESCVLEGVAAGIRGQLIRQFFECLQEDREQVLKEAEAAIGKELTTLQGVLAGGVHSLEQANEAVIGALRVVDQVVPTIAWEHLRARLPAAREPAGA